MRLMLLTGPSAAGKNTVAAAFAQRRPRCAVVDVDLVRWMVVQPHKAPWQGDEGLQQQQLGVHNACLLSTSFIAAGFDVVVLDVLSQATLAVYRERLGAFGVQIVLLLPSFDAIERRNIERGPRLTQEELVLVYEQQARLQGYDRRIDNSAIPVESMADYLNHMR